MTDQDRLDLVGGIELAVRAGIRAVLKYGKGPQAFMAMEECGELVTALCHFERGRVDWSIVEKEAADVVITAFQIGMMQDFPRFLGVLREKAERLMVLTEATCQSEEKSEPK